MLHRMALERLEPCEGKLSSTVLRGVGVGNGNVIRLIFINFHNSQISLLSFHLANEKGDLMEAATSSQLWENIIIGI
ncbi:MAG TPA: hypothetical protein VE954_31870, partial [Oligoflexus sp.]